MPLFLLLLEASLDPRFATFRSWGCEGRARKDHGSALSVSALLMPLCRPGGSPIQHG